MRKFLSFLVIFVLTLVIYQLASVQPTFACNHPEGVGEAGPGGGGDPNAGGGGNQPDPNAAANAAAN